MPCLAELSEAGRLLLDEFVVVIHGDVNKSFEYVVFISSRGGGSHVGFANPSVGRAIGQSFVAEGKRNEERKRRRPYHQEEEPGNLEHGGVVLVKELEPDVVAAPLGGGTR